MKWRLTFGDPRAPRHTTWNSTRVEVPADAVGGHVSISAAAEMASASMSVRHVGWTLIEAKLVPDGDQVVDWIVPYPVAKLAFDPTAIEDPTLQQVWGDPLARTIWIGVKYRHLTSQHFPQECLRAAGEIRRLKPTDVTALQRAMRHVQHGIKEPFWTQFLPFVLGEKQFGFVYERPAPQDAEPVPVL